MFGYVLAGLLGVALVAILLRTRRGGAAAPGTQAPPASGVAPNPILDPFMTRLYEVRSRVENLPRVSAPDELLQISPFLDLTKMLASPGVGDDTRLRYLSGEDPVLSWAALVAWEGLPRDEMIEHRVFGVLNRFVPWTRHFLLRLLAAWNPDDPTLAGRVLVRLDESWDHAAAGLVLEAFLRRVAAGRPLTLEGIERPPGFEASVLREVLGNVDPELARPLLEELRATRRRHRVMPPFMDGDGADATLEDLGRVTAPGAASDEGLIPSPTADRHLARLLAELQSDPSRSTLVVGEGGVGKTTLIQRATARLSREGWTVFEAGASQINAGMSFVGMLEARIRDLCELLSRSPRTIWIIPDFHQMLWAGRATTNPIGALELVLPYIERGEVLILGETSTVALDRVLVEKPEVARLFEVIRLEPPPSAEVDVLLEEWSRMAESRTGLAIPAAMRREATSLTTQYLSNEIPPGGVLRLFDRAIRIAVRRSDAKPAAEITIDDLIAALVQLTGLSADVLDERRTLDLVSVRRRFESRVIGQSDAVDFLVERLALIKAGVTDPTRPYGVFLFAGGTGTGKTELAKALAEVLFGSPDRLVRLDMSELQDGRALDRLLGGGDAMGVGAGNSLAERVRRQPFCVVLLDEFEKAHGRVWDVFLQVFDDGRLTDHRGDTVDFRHAILILTSNLGTTSAGEVKLGLVGGAETFSPLGVERAVARAFRPELLNRLDRIVVFRPLTREIMRLILRKELADAFERRGLRRRDWAVEMEESALDLLVEKGFSAALGARPLKRALERYLLAPLARAIVDRSAPEGDQFLFVRANGDELAVEFVDPDAQAEEAVMFALRMAPSAVALPVPADLAGIVYEPRGDLAEVGRLAAVLDELHGRVDSDLWRDEKRRLMSGPAEPGFWERPDRFETLGRAEYMDRVESSLRSASSLLERLRGNRGTRASYARDLVRRLAQQLYLLEAASGEALETGPRDAFLSVTTLHEDGAGPIASEFTARLTAMYGAWARTRGMRLVELQTASADGALARSAILAISGFAAYRLLQPEDGLHVLEREAERGEGPRRAAARVHVVQQPPTPPRDAEAFRRQALDALAASSGSQNVVRRYREQPSPLVRDAVRGWRTGRLDRVLHGDFDVIPVET